MKNTYATDDLVKRMQEIGIDVDRATRILEDYNNGRFDDVEAVRVSEIPGIDGSTIIDRRSATSIRVDAREARERLGNMSPLAADLVTGTGTIKIDDATLREIGFRLLPVVSYGVLNGGSATSYADEKKNRNVSNALFDLLREEFDRLAPQVSGKPKGVTPAFVQPDGTPGPSFLELKMRHVLLAIADFRRQFGTDGPAPGAPLFQMSSVNNDEELTKVYETYRRSPYLEKLIEETGVDVTIPATGVQPMIAAYTHSEEGRPKRFFEHAFGEEGRPLPLPGGHGQNFSVLADVYRSLRTSGKRFVYLGNVDNLGFTLDPVGVAYLALSGKQAAFDFSFRTAVDVKGGILVRDQTNHLNCADIGPAISKEEVFRVEESGTPILFNCATGLFDLDYLVTNLDRVVEDLPVRFSDQDKDAGRYSQAEQVTWEVLGMLDDYLVYGVEKWRRFLAAKMLLDTLMTSGLKHDDPAYPTADTPEKDLRRTASLLHSGLERALREEYGLEMRGDRWQPTETAASTCDSTSWGASFRLLPRTLKRLKC